MHIATISSLSLALALTTLASPADAQNGGSITTLPNTCATTWWTCTGSPTPGGALQWATGPNYAVAAYLLVDVGGLAWNGAPVPQLLPSSLPSLVGCTQLAAADVLIEMDFWMTVQPCTPGSPAVCPFPGWRLSWSVPNVQALVGWSLRTQALLFDATGAPAVTDGHAITIG